jgi:hypothetical protein
MSAELSLEELDREHVELLPDREEMSLVNANNLVHVNGVLNGSFHGNNNEITDPDLVDIG